MDIVVLCGIRLVLVIGPFRTGPRPRPLYRPRPGTDRLRCFTPEDPPYSH